MIKADD